MSKYLDVQDNPRQGSANEVSPLQVVLELQCIIGKSNYVQFNVRHIYKLFSFCNKGVPEYSKQTVC